MLVKIHKKRNKKHKNSFSQAQSEEHKEAFPSVSYEIVQSSLCAKLCGMKFQAPLVDRNVYTQERKLMTLVDKSGRGSDMKI